jgi:glycolate oxidase
MSAAAVDQGWVEALGGLLGAEGIVTDEAERRFYGSDIFRAGALPAAVAIPASIEQLQQVVRHAYRHGVPLTVRGGGASYTDAYLHAAPGGLTIATDRLTRIDIDEDNALVTVEPGVTWARLHEALAARGLRTPFFGPFSGLAATVGGSVSQNAISHGGGVSAESVVAIEVVTGTGELLATGSVGRANGAPFFRHEGPDLTGLFTGDCGTLGVKARITLKLLRRYPGFAALSFAFDSFAGMHRAMQAIAREGLDDENFGLDAALQQGQIGRNEGLGAKVEIARSVLRSSDSLGGGIRTLAKMAVAGDRALRRATYALHYLVEDVDAASAEAKAMRLRALALAHGEEIPNTVPTVVRGMPFAPLANVLGPAGERWVPMHGLFAHSAVEGFHAALEEYWAAQRGEMDALGVFNGAMFMAIGPNAFVYEPALYWPDARDVVHERLVPAEHLATLPVHPRSSAAAGLVARLRREIVALMDAHGAAHLQLGKAYPFLERRPPPASALLRALKAELDPKGILNPGALGFPPQPPPSPPRA